MKHLNSRYVQLKQLYGYAKMQARNKALQECREFIDDNPDYKMQIILAMMDVEMLERGANIERVYKDQFSITY